MVTYVDPRITKPTAYRLIASAIATVGEGEGSSSDIPEAPSDGNVYARKDESWQQLGSAALENVDAFATAEQGTKADKAIPSSAIGVSVQPYSEVLQNTTASYTTAQKNKLDSLPSNTELNNSLSSKANLTSNTFTGVQIFSGSVVENHVHLTSGVIDLSQGNYFSFTSSGDVTFSVINPPATGVPSFILEVTNGGSVVVGYMDGVVWPSGVAPVLSENGLDILCFYRVDGVWRGFSAKDLK